MRPSPFKVNGDQSTDGGSGHEASHYMCPSTDLIDFAWGVSQNALWVSLFCRPRGLSEKVEKMLNFSGSDRTIGQSDCVMQIYTRTLSNEIAFVIQPGKTHGYVKKPPSVNGRIVV